MNPHHEDVDFMAIKDDLNFMRVAILFAVSFFLIGFMVGVVS